MTLEELIDLSCVPPELELMSFAPSTDELPAIAIFKAADWMVDVSYFAVAREVKDGVIPTAYHEASTNPMPVFGRLTREEQERLNGEANAPSGTDEPVGQEAAITANDAARVGDAPNLPVVAEPLPELVTGEIVTCPDCGKEIGHEENCMYFAPSPEDLLGTEGWG